jgi:hypothetical protein
MVCRTRNAEPFTAYAAPDHRGLITPSEWITPSEPGYVDQDFR